MATIISSTASKQRSRAIWLIAVPTLTLLMITITGLLVAGLPVGRQPAVAGVETSRDIAGAAVQLPIQSVAAPNSADLRPTLPGDCANGFSGDLVGDASPREVYDALCGQTERSGR